MKKNKTTDFIKNSLTLILGSGFSQVIPLVFSLVLARVFTPIDFGILAMFMAVNSILSLIATGYYENAIMLPKEDKTSLNIVALILVLSFSVSIILAVILFFLLHFEFTFFEIENENLMLIPVSVFFNANYLSLLNWFNRCKKFALMNRTKIVQTSSTVLISLILGMGGFGGGSLIIGYVLGFCFASIPLFKIIIDNRQSISFIKMKINGGKYINYPKFMMPSSLVNVGATQAPIYFITKYFNQKIVGSFSFSQRMLNAPIAIVSVSIGQVYFKSMSDKSKISTEAIFPEFIKTFKALTLISIIVFLPIVFYGENIFVFIFGNQWGLSGSLAEIVSLSLLVKFIVTPLSTIFLVLNKLKRLATWQLLYFLVTIIIFLLFKDESIQTLVETYVVADVAMYSIYFLMMFFAVKERDQRCITNEE